MDTTITRRNYGRGHGYLNADGTKMLGVTTAIGKGTAKPALVNWAAKQAAGYAVDNWDTLGELSVSERLDTIGKQWRGENKAAMSRGTEIHGLAEKLVKGEEIDVPEHVAGYVDSYVQFLDDFSPEPLYVEAVVGNMSVQPQYAGTLDLIAQIGADTWLLDVKTGRGVYGDVAWQLAAYRYSDTIMIDGSPQAMPGIDRTGVIHVRADGYELVPVAAGPRQWLQFRYISQIAEAADESRAYVGDPVRP